MLHRTIWRTSSSFAALPTAEKESETSRLGTDSIDDAPKISAAIRENALNIC
jgi:hypothetical protein